MTVKEIITELEHLTDAELNLIIANAEYQIEENKKQNKVPGLLEGD